MYYRGLHRNIKNAMVHHHDEVKSLSDLIRVSIDLDNRLRNRFFEDGGNARPHQGNRGNHSAPRGPPRSHEQANAQGYYGAMPMELNTIKQQSRGNRPQRGRGGYNNSKRSSCYNCGKPGHKAANCGSRNTNKVRRRINVIATSDHVGSDREEWDVVETRQEIDEQTQWTALDERRHQETLEWLDNVDSSTFREQDLEELEELRKLDPEEYGNLTVAQLDLLALPELEMQYRLDCEQERPTEDEISDLELDEYDTQDERQHEKEPNWDAVRITPEPGMSDMPETRTTKKDVSGQLPIALKREVALSPGTPGHDALRYLVEEPNYASDPRNPRHGLLHWIICVHRKCAVHLHAKRQSNTFPTRRGTCHDNWNKCRIDKCEAHLYDKRRHRIFPGHSKEWNTDFRRSHGKNTPMDCGQNTWITCLKNNCERHRIEKKENGFGPNEHQYNSKGLRIATLLSSIKKNDLIEVPVTINGWHKTRALIDTGAQGTFLSRTFAKRAGVPLQRKKNPTGLWMANGNEEEISQETRPVRMTIGKHQEELVLDVFDSASHDIILGLLWLLQHLPTINLTARRIEMNGCTCMGATKPTRQWADAVDEGNKVQLPLKTDRKHKELCGIASSTRIDSESQKERISGSTTTHDNAVLMEHHALHGCPEEYRKK